MTLDALAVVVGTRLKEKGLVLATAESCTGGWVAQVVTSVSGSSEWFDRGFVTYSNDAKREMIGVRVETLDRHGAVSEETAREMAAGALAASRAQIAVEGPGVGVGVDQRKRLHRDHRFKDSSPGAPSLGPGLPRPISNASVST